MITLDNLTDTVRCAAENHVTGITCLGFRRHRYQSPYSIHHILRICALTNLTASMLNLSVLQATSSTLVQTADRLAMYVSPIGGGQNDRGNVSSAAVPSYRYSPSTKPRQLSLNQQSLIELHSRATQRTTGHTNRASLLDLSLCHLVAQKPLATPIPIHGETT